MSLQIELLEDSNDYFRGDHAELSKKLAAAEGQLEKTASQLEASQGIISFGENS